MCEAIVCGDQNNDMSTHERKGLKMRWIVFLHEKQFSDVEQVEFGAVIQKKDNLPSVWGALNKPSNSGRLPIN